jgi:hypothetical protein
MEGKYLAFNALLCTGVFPSAAPPGLGGLLVFNFLLTCRPAGALCDDL